MNHRHTTESIYESPECTADLAEFALSIVLNLIHHCAVNGAMVTLTLIYTNLRSENQWEMAIILQLLSCFALCTASITLCCSSPRALTSRHAAVASRSHGAHRGGADE